MPDPKENAKPSVSDMLEKLMDKMDDLGKRLDAVEDKQKAGPHVTEREFGADRPVRDEPEYSHKPWEEEIWVIALVDCTYPNPPESSNAADQACNYGIYRRAGKPEQPAIPFRLKHREHLHRNLKVLTEGQIETIKAAVDAPIPMTNARGVRQTSVPV